MKKNNNKIYNVNLIITVFVIILLSIIFIFCRFSACVKYSYDYSLLDLLLAQKVALGYNEPTKDVIRKYDMNEDGEITNTDVLIIQHLIIGDI